MSERERARCDERKEEPNGCSGRFFLGKSDLHQMTLVVEISQRAAERGDCEHCEDCERVLSDERIVGIVRWIVRWEDDWDCVGCCSARLAAERDGLVGGMR